MNIKEIQTAIESMHAADISALTSDLCAKWNVDISKPAPPVIYGDVYEPEEQTEFSVRLVSHGPAAKITVIKVIRELTGLGLGEAKKAVESLPFMVREGISKADAGHIAAKITAAGGVVETL